MKFLIDVFSLRSDMGNFNLAETGLPNNIHVYFRAKQSEMIDQYVAARAFLQETETNDWNHWFHTAEGEDAAPEFKLRFVSYFYEAALMYYNILVDLSWTLCYVSTEFAITQKGERVYFTGMKTIEEAADFLRKAENNVANPSVNGIGYLKMHCPEYSNVIDMVIDFWNHFGNSTIRNRYNFCKHKGKPAYIELEELRGPRFMNIYLQHKELDGKLQLASNISDVQLRFSLREAIAELREFDDNTLYPYIKGLFQELEDVLNPLPMI